MAKPRLRWRRESRETGLRAVVQGERGYELWYGDERVASASPYGRYRPEQGYYWSAPSNERLGIALKNTASQPVATIEEAKEQAMAYVRAALKKREEAS